MLVYQTCVPYVSMGITNALYTCHQFRKSKPHMELPRMLMPLMVEQAWLTMMLTCFFHLRLAVIKTPRKWREVTAVMLCVLLESLYWVPQILAPERWGWRDLEKTISSVFAESAERPLLPSQTRKSSKLAMADRVVAEVVMEVV